MSTQHDSQQEIFPDILTARQVSAITGIPSSTLHMWAVKRENGFDSPGPHHLRLSERLRRWSRADVLAWLAQSRL